MKHVSVAERPDVVVGIVESHDVPQGLVYVSDEVPGISRHRRGKGFVYRQPDGSPLKDAAQLLRIRSLAIPPAYTQVWIATHPGGHLQATARDARGRKQYRYHPLFRSSRDAGKFDRLAEFASVLPRLRARVAADLARPSTDLDTVLATIVRLLDTTMARVGNDEYARSNGSFGLTTLRRRHAALHGSSLMLRFRGKSGVTQELTVDDPKVARVIRRCQHLPGQALFQHIDAEGRQHTIASSDVNAYLRRVCGGDFTAKDFRTWHASVHALALAQRLADIAPPKRASPMKQLLGEVAARLGNTVTVCRKSYVHPQVLAVLSGDVAWPARATTRVRRPGLNADERAFVALLSSQTPGQSKEGKQK